MKTLPFLFLLILSLTSFSQEIEVHQIYPEYGNTDTLKYQILSTGDVDAYNKLRLSIGTWDLVPYSEIMAYQYDYHPALTDLYVAYITLFEHYSIDIPMKIRQKSNNYLKKAYMSGDFCAKTMLYVRYKNGIYIEKDTSLASLIKNSDTTIYLSPADTLIFYCRNGDIGDIYTLFFVVSGRVQGAKILVYNDKGKSEYSYNRYELNHIGQRRDKLADCNVVEENGHTNITNDLDTLLRTIFVQHGGQIEECGWRIFIE